MTITAERPRPKPSWIRVKAPGSPEYSETAKLMRAHSLNTVCEEAACPNIGECWAHGHATVMILGDICTRACGFCNIATGRPRPVDPFEPENLALAVGKLGLKHVVITSVDRDDLADGGAGQFVACIGSLRAHAPDTTIEILTPDFLHKDNALESVVDAKPDVFNHNVETVPRLYASVRKGARYEQSIGLLRRAKERDASLFTKSGLMVGLGETIPEVYRVMDDLREADVDFITIGQYLQPTRNHLEVVDFITPAAFEDLARVAADKGFLQVSATPLTRSSYHAGENFQQLVAAREARIS